MRAALTVACDGRSSTLRAAAGLVPRGFGAPMDVWWFRLPAAPTTRPGSPACSTPAGPRSRSTVATTTKSPTSFPKDPTREMRAQGIEALHRKLVSMVPWLADRVDTLTSFDDVKLLDVEVNRLHRWYSDGLLCIGDAAHAMSPVGGVGINLAVADAVAAARILAGPLRTGQVSTAPWHGFRCAAGFRRRFCKRCNG